MAASRDFIHHRSSSSRQTQVLILDFGSKYTNVVAGRVRELCVSVKCLSGTTSLPEIRAIAPSLIILGGSDSHSSVHEPSAPLPANEFFDYVAENGIAVLGICYGLHILVHLLEGFVRPAAAKSQQQQQKYKYGHMEIHVDKESELFKDDYYDYVEQKQEMQTQRVWMSHGGGDEIVQVLPGFRVVARTSLENRVAAIECSKRKLYGLQFYPEVTHTLHGLKILHHFLFGICGLDANWKLEDVLEEEIRKTKVDVGKDDHAICVLSGGVDSVVAATLYTRLLETNFTVFL